MKYLLFVLLAVAATFALDNGPMDAIPYCLPVTLGVFSDKGGFAYNATDSYNTGFAFAMYRNGENLGLDHFAWYDDFNYFYTNGSAYEVGIGALWDFGSDYWTEDSGVGVIDGTYDTVDGAMSISFDDDTTYGLVNLTTTCIGDTGFSMVTQIPNGLQLTRTFFVPKGPVESWARVVDVVFNPTDASITSKIGYKNDLGSDSTTVFVEFTDRYTLSTDNVDTPDDNVVSLHWEGKNSLLDGQVQWHTAPTDGSGTLSNYYNVTIEPGQTKTFMFVMVQGNQSISYTSQLAAEVDANPLKLYYGMSSEQISTLQNFNACSAAVPEFASSDFSYTSNAVCSADGLVEATVTANSWATLFPAALQVVILNSNNEQQEVLTAASTQVSLPAGSYTARVQLGEECVLATVPFTAACEAAPSSGPSTAPVATTSSASMIAASLSMVAIALAL